MGLVVASQVDGQLVQDLSGGGVDDADFVVLDEQDDVDSADADVVHLGVDAQCDDAGVVDTVVSDAVVGVVIEAAVGVCRTIR